MIAQVATGITTKYTGSALATLLTGGLWRDRAEQEPTFPYSVFTCISSSNYDTFLESMEFQHLMFYIWTNDLNPDTATTGLDALETALRTLFDNAILTISGWTNLGMRWIGSRPANSEDDTVIGTMIEYETYIQDT